MRLLKVPHYEMLGGREELERSLPDFQPIVRAIEPREVAGPAAFLLSNLASAMTGTAVGWTSASSRMHDGPASGAGRRGDRFSRSM